MSDASEVYYIVLRGSGWQPIFKDDEDLRRFTQGVAECAATCRVTVHAWCWLATEARLAVQMADVPISQFAQCMAEWHTRRMEREVALTGSHFEQKYRGVRVDGQTALVDLVRHIHLAPLKAGLTDDLTYYPWSSHRTYLGLQPCPGSRRPPPCATSHRPAGVTPNAAIESSCFREWSSSTRCRRARTAARPLMRPICGK